MRAFLLYENDDLALQMNYGKCSSSLTQDLEIETLCKAMARGDDFIYKITTNALISGLNNNIDTILYRQEVLRDCLNNQFIVRKIYEITVEAIETKNKHFWISSNKYPSSILSNSVSTLKDLMTFLKQIKNMADEHTGKFKSKGFVRFFDVLKKELDDKYFDTVQNHLQELEFEDGILFSATLGNGNKGTNYIIRKPLNKKNWLQRLFERKQPVFSFRINDRDISGAKALGDLNDEVINTIANTVAQASDHIINFFTKLKEELAFYIGCLNLHDQLLNINEPVAFPIPVEQNQRIHSFKGLYDVCLALTLKQKIVGNDASINNKNLVIITGANQGGKSTFLRSIGLSQLMMQCGMFVPAESYTANICNSIFTHFKREEDKTMESGKLDEELKRFSNVVDNINSNSLLLFNESFAATNDREGSEIAGQIVRALFEKGIKIFFVTHLFEFANNFYHKTKDVLYLRAERQPDGTRTYKLIEGKPLQTSFGEDLYHRIFE